MAVTLALCFLSTVALWSMLKKKPLVVQKHTQEHLPASLAAQDVWVTAVAALPFTDLVVSGKLVLTSVCKQLWGEGPCNGRCFLSTDSWQSQ